MKTITIQWLRNNDACDGQVNLIKRLFGETIELTQENWDKAIANDVEVSWLEDYLSPNQRKKYDISIQPAKDECKKIQDPAVDEYEDVVGPVREAYKKILWSNADYETKQLAFVEYQKIQNPAFEKYNSIFLPAEEVFDKIANQALFEALISDVE
jgi:hypothetical protein